MVGLPEDERQQALTVTEQYFHVKYAPEGRGESAGGETVAGTQAIFHRPASSGIYALVYNLDLYRIGLNDITRQYVVGDTDRQVRARALIQALAASIMKPTGAQRNTQNPHIVSCEGVIATSNCSLPAPAVSPLNSKYREEMERIAGVLNSIKPEAIKTYRFSTLDEGLKILADLSNDMKAAGV